MPVRVTIPIDRRELTKWQQRFAYYGTKTQFEAENNVSRQTLHKILKDGRGDATIIQKIREFVGRDIA